MHAITHLRAHARRLDPLAGTHAPIRSEELILLVNLWLGQVWPGRRGRRRRGGGRELPSFLVSHFCDHITPSKKVYVIRWFLSIWNRLNGNGNPTAPTPNWESATRPYRPRPQLNVRVSSEDTVLRVARAVPMGFRVKCGSMWPAARHGTTQRQNDCGNMFEFLIFVFEGCGFEFPIPHSRNVFSRNVFGASSHSVHNIGESKNVSVQVRTYERMNCNVYNSAFTTFVCVLSKTK